MKLIGRQAALFGAGALALSFMLVFESHIAKTDAFLCGLAAICFAALAHIRTASGPSKYHLEGLIRRLGILDRSWCIYPDKGARCAVFSGANHAIFTFWEDAGMAFGPSSTFQPFSFSFFCLCLGPLPSA